MTKMTWGDILLRTVATVGLVAILLLGAWGIIQIAFAMPAFFEGVGNAFRGSGAATAVTQPAPAKVPVAKVATAAKGYAQKGAALYGLPNLSVRIISTGVINRATGMYLPTRVIRPGDRVGVQFIIENNGTNATPANWYFTASLPSSPTQNYASPAQPTLLPGGRVVYTLGFDVPYNNCRGDCGYGAYYGAYSYFGGTICITADPAGYVAESNRADNSATTDYYLSY